MAAHRSLAYGRVQAGCARAAHAHLLRVYPPRFSLSARRGIVSEERHQHRDDLNRDNRGYQWIVV